MAAAVAEVPASTPGGPAERSPWLDSFHDQLAGLRCFSSCVRFADLFGDGESRMVVADTTKRLKVYRGTAVVSEHALLDRPVSVCAFHDEVSSSNSTTPTRRSPGIAVAAGPFVFIYRNLRPYFKFTVEEVQLDPVEVDLWRSLQTNDAFDLASASEVLVQARNGGTRLSSRSLDFLALEGDAPRQQAYVAAVRFQPLKQETAITCMETIPMTEHQGPDVASVLVLGTESRLVLILQPSATSVACRVELDSVPVFMAVTGAFAVDWRIVVACRNGKLFTITSGDVRGTATVKKPQIDLESQPCGGVVRVDKQIYVGTMDQQLHCFSIKGKKLFSLRQPAAITNLELFHVRLHNAVSGVIVALANGEVRTYRGKDLINTIHVGDVVTALRFGRFSREDNTLAIVTRSGAVTVKMLQRHATLDAPRGGQGPPPEQDVPLPVPKKTQLYLDQTERERSHSTAMHNAFQNDLCKLRLQASRAFVKLITDGHLGESPVGGTSIRLNAAVLGVGPFFKIRVELQNGGVRVLTNVPLVTAYNHDVYRMSKSRVVLPVLLPGLTYEHMLDVECIGDGGLTAGAVRILVLNPSSAVPFVSAVVNMPQSEELD